MNLQHPSTKKEVKTTLSHVSWYREVIHDYATKTLLISKLQQKIDKFEWTQECQQAFDQLKRDLSSYLVLKPLNWSQLFHVYCDVSLILVSSTLCQSSIRKRRDYPIIYASR